MRKKYLLLAALCLASSIVCFGCSDGETHTKPEDSFAEKRAAAKAARDAAKAGQPAPTN